MRTPSPGSVAGLVTTMGKKPRTPDWTALLRGWDAQQESFSPLRERRFSAMLEVLGASVGTRFTSLDLGSGPGSLSVRLLRRFPAARVIAVDYDPVTLAIGRGALGSQKGRLTWVDAKLGAPGWTDGLPRRRIDAAVSTTALHWLSPAGLRSLYRDLAELLPRGGIFLNGDYLAWGARDRGLRHLAAKVYRQRLRGVAPGKEWSAWTEWWERAERIPALRPYFEERKRRAAHHPKRETVSIGVHEEALRRAGFREVDVVWQDIENRVLFARR
ncbi:MAG: class I SAM-dependent methyltransferase [Thermoplasmata archaeon]